MDMDIYSIDRMHDAFSAMRGVRDILDGIKTFDQVNSMEDVCFVLMNALDGALDAIATALHDELAQ